MPVIQTYLCPTTISANKYTAGNDRQVTSGSGTLIQTKIMPVACNLRTTLQTKIIKGGAQDDARTFFKCIEDLAGSPELSWKRDIDDTGFGKVALDSYITIDINKPDTPCFYEGVHLYGIRKFTEKQTLFSSFPLSTGGEIPEDKADVCLLVTDKTIKNPQTLFVPGELLQLSWNLKINGLSFSNVVAGKYFATPAITGGEIKAVRGEGVNIIYYIDLQGSILPCAPTDFADYSIGEWVYVLKQGRSSATECERQSIFSDGSIDLDTSESGTANQSNFEIIDIINRARISAGATPFNVDNNLNEAARVHIQEMIAAQQTPPDGSEVDHKVGGFSRIPKEKIGAGDGVTNPIGLSDLSTSPISSDPDHLPVVTVKGDGQLMTVNISSTGSCSGDCSSGGINMVTGVWEEDITFTSIPVIKSTIEISYYSEGAGGTTLFSRVNTTGYFSGQTTYDVEEYLSGSTTLQGESVASAWVGGSDIDNDETVVISESGILDNAYIDVGFASGSKGGWDYLCMVLGKVGSDDFEDMSVSSLRAIPMSVNSYESGISAYDTLDYNMLSAINFTKFFEVSEHIGIITEVSTTIDAAKIDIEGLGKESFSWVDIFYHCQEATDTTGGVAAFSVGDEVLVLNEGGGCTPSESNLVIVGFKEGLKNCGELVVIFRFIKTITETQYLVIKIVADNLPEKFELNKPDGSGVITQPFEAVSGIFEGYEVETIFEYNGIGISNEFEKSPAVPVDVSSIETGVQTVDSSTVTSAATSNCDSCSAGGKTNTACDWVQPFTTTTTIQRDRTATFEADCNIDYSEAEWLYKDYLYENHNAAVDCYYTGTAGCFVDPPNWPDVDAMLAAAGVEPYLKKEDRYEFHVYNLGAIAAPEDHCNSYDGLVFGEILPKTYAYIDGSSTKSDFTWELLFRHIDGTETAEQSLSAAGQHDYSTESEFHGDFWYLKGAAVAIECIAATITDNVDPGYTYSESVEVYMSRSTTLVDENNPDEYLYNVDNLEKKITWAQIKAWFNVTDAGIEAIVNAEGFYEVVILPYSVRSIG